MTFKTISLVLALLATLPILSPAAPSETPPETPEAADSHPAGVVRFSSTTEHTYAGSIVTDPLGNTSLKPASYWVGEKLFVQGNRCVLMTKRLRKMDTIAVPGGRLQVPQFDVEKRAVDCTVGSDGTFSWSGKLAQ